MDSKVIRAFYDMQDPKETVYQVGSIYSAEPERIAELVEKGFVIEQKPVRKTKANVGKKG